MAVKRQYRWTLNGLFCLFLFCVAAEVRATETLAVLPFENNSFTTPERYEPLAKGFAAMLTTDMSRKVQTLKMVERTRVDALLRELTLGMTGAVDEQTAVQAGKILGAQYIAFGSFTVLEEEVRMDIRIIRVETSEVVAAEYVAGRSGEILTLIAGLAVKIGGSFKESVALDPAGQAGTGKLDAALSFARGLEALDRGLTEEAKMWFEKCLQIDPLYRAHIADLNIPD